MTKFDIFCSLLYKEHGKEQMIICQRYLIKRRSKMIFREEIAKFTPNNQVLRPDYLGVGPTGVESKNLTQNPYHFATKDPP